MGNFIAIAEKKLKTFVSQIQTIHPLISTFFGIGAKNRANGINQIKIT